MRICKPTLFVCALLASLTVGCSQKSAELRLTSLSNNAAFTQTFTDAYIGETAEGDTEVVLAGGNANGLRQVMHLKVLWRPQRGTKQGHPSYTNAGLHWYVFEPGRGTTNALEYSGAGFVSLSESPLGTQVNIRNATLKPVDNAKSSLTDPVGPAKLTGTFFATRDNRRVEEVLGEVKVAMSGTETQHASAR